MGRPKKEYTCVVCGKQYKGYSRSHTCSMDCTREKLHMWYREQRRLRDRLFGGE